MKAKGIGKGLRPEETRLPSDIHDPRSMAQGANGVFPVGNEFLGHESLIARGQDLFEDGWIENLLVLVHLATTGVSCRVVVSNPRMVGADAADDIAIHNLNMVDIEQQFEARRVPSASPVRCNDQHRHRNSPDALSWDGCHRVS